jgi:hypothetical protein
MKVRGSLKGRDMTGDKKAMESQDESARKPHGIEPIELVGDTDQRRVTRERGRVAVEGIAQRRAEDGHSDPASGYAGAGSARGKAGRF